MPRRKTFGRKRFRRKVNRKRKSIRRKGKATSLRLKGPTGFPDRMFVKLKYAAILSIAVTSGVAVEYIFRGNSLNDPDETGGGHQPYSFDQWAALYGKYRVHGSKIRAQILPQTTDSASTFSPWLAVYPNLATTVTAYPFPLQELPYVTYRFTNIYQGASRYNIIKKYMSTSKIAGVKKLAVEAEDGFAAAYNANPSNQWYWHFVVGTLNNVDTGSIRLIVELHYYAEFFNRNTLASS